jgi:hypothetical protein
MNYELIQTITGILGLITIFLFWWQIRSEKKWEKIKFSIDKIDRSLVQKNGKIIKDFGIDVEKDTMSIEDFNKLTDEQNSEILYRVQDILDMFERFSTLYNMNSLNKSFAYGSYSETIMFTYSKYKDIIEFYRNKYDPFYYENLEKCASEFFKIKENEDKNFKKNIKKFNKLKQKTTKKLDRLQEKIKHKSSIINKF